MAETQHTQLPVGHRTRFAVHVTQVRLGDLQVSVDHLERLVAESAPQRKHIAAVPKECDGKRVPEAVHRHVPHPTPLTDALQRVPKVVPLNRTTLRRRKQRTALPLRLCTAGSRSAPAWAA